MRRYLAMLMVVLVLFMVLLSYPNQHVLKSVKAKETTEQIQVIPDEAIRLRILAHSDDEKDQQIKHMVRDAVNEEITGWVEHMTDIEEARSLIKSRLHEIEQIVGAVLIEAGSDLTYEVEYGSNITFPAKLYDQYLYPPGEYEAILITIGDGLGSNWWCVLFPPLCFLDFSFGTTVASDTDLESEDDTDDMEYEDEGKEIKIKFFLFEWFGWS